jgi:hypothetical protein
MEQLLYLLNTNATLTFLLSPLTIYALVSRSVGYVQHK